MMRLYFTLRLFELLISVVSRAISLLAGLLWILLILMWIAVASLKIGVPQTIDWLADQFVQKVIEIGITPVWDQRIYNICRVIGFLTIILGWLITAKLMVYIVKWLV